MCLQPQQPLCVLSGFTVQQGVFSRLNVTKQVTNQPQNKMTVLLVQQTHTVLIRIVLRPVKQVTIVQEVIRRSHASQEILEARLAIRIWLLLVPLVQQEKPVSFLEQLPIQRHVKQDTTVLLGLSAPFLRQSLKEVLDVLSDSTAQKDHPPKLLVQVVNTVIELDSLNQLETVKQVTSALDPQQDRIHLPLMVLYAQMDITALKDLLQQQSAPLELTEMLREVLYYQTVSLVQKVFIVKQKH